MQRYQGKNPRLMRSVGVLVDQIASSASNLLILVALARMTSAPEFGIVSVAMLFLVLALGLFRAMGPEVSYVQDVGSERKPDIARAAQFSSLALAVGVPGGLIVLMAGLIMQRFSDEPTAVTTPVALIAISVPLACLQDGVRHYFLLISQPWRAATADVLWLLFSAAALLAAQTPSQAIGLWALGSIAASVFFLPSAVGGASVGALRGWFAARSTRLMVRQFSLEFLAINASNATIWIGLGLVASVSDTGHLRGAFLLFSPLNSLFAAAIPLFLPLIARGGRPDSRFAMICGGVLSSFAVGWSILVFLAPANFGMILLGDSYLGAATLIPYVAIHYMLLCCFFSLNTLFRATRQVLLSGVLRYTFALTSLVGPLIGAILDGAQGAALGFPLALAVSLASCGTVSRMSRVRPVQPTSR